MTDTISYIGITSQSANHFDLVDPLNTMNKEHKMLFHHLTS